MGSYKQDQWEELGCLLRKGKENTNMQKAFREQRPDSCLEQVPRAHSTPNADTEEDARAESTWLLSNV